MNCVHFYAANWFNFDNYVILLSILFMIHLLIKFLHNFSSEYKKYLQLNSNDNYVQTEHENIELHPFERLLEP